MRNKLVAKFLASQHTDMLFIDSDLAWSAADLLKLLACDVPLVAGVYQRKSLTKLDFTVKFGPSTCVRRAFNEFFETKLTWLRCRASGPTGRTTCPVAARRLSGGVVVNPHVFSFLAAAQHPPTGPLQATAQTHPAFPA